MYLNVESIDVTRHNNGGYIFYTVVKNYGDGNIGYVGQKFMTERDMLRWCDREYPHATINPVYKEE